MKPLLLTLTLAFSLFTGSLLAADEKPADKAAEGPLIVFVIGEKEYGTRSTLPAFAESHLKPRGYRSRFVFAKTDDRKDPGVHEFPGLKEALEDADLLFVSARRRLPVKEDLDLIRQWVADGKPVLGVRTSSHAFASRPKGEGYTLPEGHDEWPAFDRDVFGATYEGHFQNKPNSQGIGTVVSVEADASGHAVLQGIELKPGDGVSCTLYRSRELGPDTTTLLMGEVPGSGEREPVAWVRDTGKGRSFYTSLVSEPDMDREWVKQLLVNAVDWLTTEW